MYVSKSTICELNNDCLWEVFRDFDFKERVGLERVCKQWQRVVKDLISETTESLTFNEKTKDTFGYPIYRRQQIGGKVLIFEKYQFLNVKEVKITVKNTQTSYLVIQPKHLKCLYECLLALDSLKLKHIELVFDKIDSKRKQKAVLRKLGNQLKSLHLFDLKGHHLQLLRELLRNVGRLKYYSVDLKLLKALKVKMPSVEYFRINDCYIDGCSEEWFLDFLAQNPHLESIKICNFWLDESVFKTKVLFYPNIKTLCLKTFSLCVAKIEAFLKLMPNLIQLKLSDFVITPRYRPGHSPGYSDCLEEVKKLVEILSNFSNLKTLTLKPDDDSGFWQWQVMTEKLIPFFAEDKFGHLSTFAWRANLTLSDTDGLEYTQCPLFEALPQIIKINQRITLMSSFTEKAFKPDGEYLYRNGKLLFLPKPLIMNGNVLCNPF